MDCKKFTIGNNEFQYFKKEMKISESNDVCKSKNSSLAFVNKKYLFKFEQKMLTCSHKRCLVNGFTDKKKRMCNFI